ncbi:protein phosphatase CheZ [Cohaesibacter celericrescens]|uniref:Chemotaxis protein n=1 Tax=Cohaesibacter celericrescens TaxID=2067669 RepID=A0A2N5XKW7_9HYPH|nr:protein phosphatase CheZ [Cohaesibacter celericrescens]PLW75077.1 chemotaxis protein [Cohaesibacter celericrescens]
MGQAKQLKVDKVAQLVTFLETNKGENLTLTDIMSMAEVMAGSLESCVQAMDKSLYQEFESIASEISSMKKEIASLSPGEMRDNHIPEAGRELDAVVEATETATNIIMSSAEEIMAADPSDTKAYQEIVNDKVIEIFEACSFQDITGQRISKVVHALKVIDERVAAFIDRLKVDDHSDYVREESDQDRRKREQILHGPQLVGEGVNQSEVDAMMADFSFDKITEDDPKGSSQDDIDALFG